MQNNKFLYLIILILSISLIVVTVQNLQMQNLANQTIDLELQKCNIINLK
jgi:hypothetical protein